MLRTILPAAVLALLLAAGTAEAKLSVPGPTGASPVGYTRAVLTDRSRPETIVPGGGARRIVVRVWYPAAAPAPAPAVVFTERERATLVDGLGLLPDALDGLGDPATTAARPARGRHPLLVFSHGLGTTSAFHTATAIDLASHGYVVAAVDHPGDAAVVDLGDRLVAALPVDDRLTARLYRQRVRDLSFALTRVLHMHGIGRIDRRRVGVYGHSLGGAAAAGAMAADRRFRAGVDIDGTPRGTVVRRGLGRAFGVLLGARHLLRNDRLLARFVRHLRGPHPIAHRPRTGHLGFTDLVWIAPQIGLTGMFDLGTQAPARAIAQQRTWLRRFFDRYL